MLNCEVCYSEDHILMCRDERGKNVFKLCPYCEETVKRQELSRGATLLLGTIFPDSDRQRHVTPRFPV